MRRRADLPLRCGACGRATSQVHEELERVVRDLPLFDALTYLKIRSHIARFLGPLYAITADTPVVVDDLRDDDCWRIVGIIEPESVF